MGLGQQLHNICRRDIFGAPVAAAAAAAAVSAVSPSGFKHVNLEQSRAIETFNTAAWSLLPVCLQSLNASYLLYEVNQGCMQQGPACRPQDIGDIGSNLDKWKLDQQVLS